MKHHDMRCGVPEGYAGPELVIVTKNPNNHKARYERVTERNPDYDKIYLVEKALRKLKYFNEPSDGLIMYWSSADEFEEMFGYIVANPSIWEMAVAEEDATTLVIGSFSEEFDWEDR